MCACGATSVCRSWPKRAGKPFRRAPCGTPSGRLSALQVGYFGGQCFKLDLLTLPGAANHGGQRCFGCPTICVQAGVPMVSGFAVPYTVAQGVVNRHPVTEGRDTVVQVSAISNLYHRELRAQSITARNEPSTACRDRLCGRRPELPRPWAKAFIVQVVSNRHRRAMLYRLKAPGGHQRPG
jgi:hypothetical protein